MNNDDVFKIMLATDLHLGVHEKDVVRADDSYTTFEEILRLSTDQDVDFVLLAGDMFHENKPSAICVRKTMELLRKYCMGDKPITVEFLSDENENFKHCSITKVNYQDPNYNISIPVYSIHGNHDDPCGFGQTSALDILSVSGLVNYFGKCTDLTQIKLKPILLKKGRTKLAIYGISHIKDERLNRLFKARLVEFERPPNPDSWFNVLLLHQNRVERTTSTNCIPESFIPTFFDLVFWGHEHECRIEPEPNSTQEFYITQPGSPVATSLCEAEAVEKKVGILNINKKDFKLDPIKLKTVRPFIFETAKVSDWNQMDENWTHEEVQAYASRFVKSKLILKAKDQLSGHPKQPVLPLIRLRLEYTEEAHAFNRIRFGQTFSDQVANPSELILLKKIQPATRTSKKEGRMQGSVDMDELIGREQDNLRVETIVNELFNDKNNKQQLEVLSVAGMAEAITRFIDKDDKDSIEDLVRHQMQRVVTHLKSNLSNSNVEECLNEFRELRCSKVKEDVEEVRTMFEGNMRGMKGNPFGTTLDSNTTAAHTMSDDDDLDFGPPLAVEEKKRGRGAKARGSRARGSTTRGRRGARGAANSSLSSNDRSIVNFLSTSAVGASFKRNDSESQDFDEFSYHRTPKKKARLNYNEDD